MEEYVDEQARDNTYDLDANLAVLKFYQFNPHSLNMEITYLILLKALTNLPHTDFVLCKSLLLPSQLKDETVQKIIDIADILEQCDFALFWSVVESKKDLFENVSGFYDSIRKFVCHVVSATFQTIDKNYLSKLLGDLDGEYRNLRSRKVLIVSVCFNNFLDNSLKSWVKKYGWKEQNNLIYIENQEERIKTKHITEKIDLESLGHMLINI